MDTKDLESYISGYDDYCEEQEEESEEQDIDFVLDDMQIYEN